MKDVKNPTVMVFGTFDLIHDGHRYFLNQAKRLGRLIVVVASDEAVVQLKKNKPSHSSDIRAANLAATDLAEEIVIGDKVLGEWNAIKTRKPDIVVLGYDQNRLGRALKKFIKSNQLKTRCVVIGPYQDGNLHSSRLR